MRPGVPARLQPLAGHLLAAVLFVALTVAMTWPLARNLDRAVSDPGDPLLNLWILDWDWWATLHQPLGLYHANAFHPARYSLAFSENLYGIALFLFPLRAAGVGPVAAYNVAMIAGIAFCGLGAFLLGRRLTGSFAAGVAAGVFYAFVPFRFVHLAHVQHMWGGWLPLMLLALLGYAERPSWKRGALFAAMFVMNGLANIHYLFFGALATAVTAALLVPRRAWRELAIPVGLGLLLLAPFLYPYAAAQKLYGMERNYDEVLRYSATAADWFRSGAADGEPERKVNPGALALVTSALSLVVARRQKARLALAGLWIVLGFAGSLGLHFVFHEFLFGGVPGFRAIRSPARWAVIAYIGMAILIALATAAIRNRWVAWIVPAAFVVSLWAAPVRWFLVDPVPPPVYRWLAGQRVTAVAELPMDKLSSDYEYLMHATAHHQRLVNGVSGFSPPVRTRLSQLSREYSDAFLPALAAADVELLIVHADRYGEDGRTLRDWLQRELERGRLRYVAHFDARTGADWVFALGRGKGPRPHELEVFLYGAPTCTRSIAGALDSPPGEHRFRGAARFRGWASSPNGIAAVDVWFENRGVKFRARTTQLLPQKCPGPPPVAFELAFASRPGNVRRATDVQVEVTDGRGNTTVFEDRWIVWE